MGNCKFVLQNRSSEILRKYEVSITRNFRDLTIILFCWEKTIRLQIFYALNTKPTRSAEAS